MNRRQFIKDTGKIVSTGLLSTGLTSCVRLDDVFDPDNHISLTNGKTWTNLQLSVPIAASGLGWDNNGSVGPTVIKDGSTYKMWYAGNNGANNRILYYESSNGVSWTNFQLSVDINSSGTGLDTTDVVAPTVINESGVGKMWYHARGTNNQILYGESR